MILGRFGHFGPKPMNYLAPIGCKLVEKTAHHPLGVTSDALWRVYLCRRGIEYSKYTLLRASEVTPRGWCPVFFHSLRPIGCPVIHRFGPKWPKWPKITQKWKSLFLALFSGSYRAVRPPCRRFSKKMGNPPPLDHPPGGAHFFPKFGARVV